MYQLGLCDEHIRLSKLSQLGDHLERLNSVIDWEIFRPILKKATKRSVKGPGGRPVLYDHVMLFKILILARLYNLSDDQTEYQINDRRSFMRFLELGPGCKVPDAKTIWLFRDTLTKSGVIDELFSAFEHVLEEQHLITRNGSIVDATFVEAPIQRNTPDENKKIKEGRIPEEWQGNTSKQRNKLRQKDVDARFAIKGGKTFFGYKDHVKVDADSKLIVSASVTPASVHDSQECIGLLDEKDNALYGDSAYSGSVISDQLPGHVRNEIHEKGYRNHQLTQEQKERNRKKSHVRARVEHVFGFMTTSMHGITIRCIGKVRAEFAIGIMNLTYNLCRFETLVRCKSPLLG